MRGYFKNKILKQSQKFRDNIRLDCFTSIIRSILNLSIIMKRERIYSFNGEKLIKSFYEWILPVFETYHQGNY